jgi:hypothetical protein
MEIYADPLARARTPRDHRRTPGTRHAHGPRPPGAPATSNPPSPRRAVVCANVSARSTFRAFTL